MGLEAARIPNGWVHTSLEAVCQILDSRRVPVNNSERSRRIAGKSANTLYPYYGATGQVGVIDDFIFEGEHILVGEDGAPFLDPYKAKAYLVRNKFWVNNHAHILRSTVSNKYICHYLNHIDYSDHVTGTTRLKLTQNAIKSIPIYVAPVAEQHRIVAKIEALFYELDKCVESLKTARAKLDVYRQAVLKHAFDGKLTTQWREENKAKLETPEQLLARVKQAREICYKQQLEEWNTTVKAREEGSRSGKKPMKPSKLKEIHHLSLTETETLPSLPIGWSYLRMGLVIDEPKYGSSKKCDYDYKGTGVLRIPNVVRGVVDASDLKGAHFGEEEKRIYGLRSGDILLIRSNGSISIVGRSALISKADEQYLYAGYLIRLRSNLTALLPEFLTALLASHLLRTQIEDKAKSTSGVNNINSGEIQSLVIPLCSISEQKIVVERLSTSLSAIDAIEAEIYSHLLKIEALRQSILKKVFSGQLVTQDPNDEPASVLLERIRAERENAAKNNRYRKTKKRTTSA